MKKMNHLTMPLLVSTLLVSSFSATATVITVARAESGVMPVLVTVANSGKVTNVVATEQLKPSFNRLLRKNIQEMIPAPAYSGGHAQSSQVVMRMRLDVTSRPDGDYDAKFVVVDSTPVPTGNWYWAIGDGRYALADYQPRYSGANDAERVRGHGNDLRAAPSALTPTPIQPMPQAAPAAHQFAPSSPRQQN